MWPIVSRYLCNSIPPYPILTNFVSRELHSLNCGVDVCVYVYNKMNGDTPSYSLPKYPVYEKFHCM